MKRIFRKNLFTLAFTCVKRTFRKNLFTLAFTTSVKRIFRKNLFILAFTTSVKRIFCPLVYVGVFCVCVTYLFSEIYFRLIVFIIPCNVLCSNKSFTLALPASVQRIFRSNFFT